MSQKGIYRILARRTIQRTCSDLGSFRYLASAREKLIDLLSCSFELAGNPTIPLINLIFHVVIFEMAVYGGQEAHETMKGTILEEETEDSYPERHQCVFV